MSRQNLDSLSGLSQKLAANAARVDAALDSLIAPVIAVAPHIETRPAETATPTEPQHRAGEIQKARRRARRTY